jgi:ADP-ribose pyrophosphatase YjhB (NUDIX family)
MTYNERNAIQTQTFTDLWKLLWQTENTKHFVRDYTESKAKFEKLRQGFILKLYENETTLFNIDYLINNSVSNVVEAEWGFPKGRRNINEHDFSCAFREFREETGINPKYIRVYADTKPFEETFSGTNNVRYKHVYYLASCLNEIKIDVATKTQVKEIKDIRWFSYEKAQEKINSRNVERKELLKRANTIVTRIML